MWVMKKLKVTAGNIKKKNHLSQAQGVINYTSGPNTLPPRGHLPK